MIDCLPRDDTFLQTYCLIHSTYSLVDAWDKEVGVNVLYPGIDLSGHKEKRIYHTYYQWVS